MDNYLSKYLDRFVHEAKKSAQPTSRGPSTLRTCLAQVGEEPQSLADFFWQHGGTLAFYAYACIEAAAAQKRRNSNQVPCRNILGHLRGQSPTAFQGFIAALQSQLESSCDEQHIKKIHSLIQQKSAKGNAALPSAPTPSPNPFDMTISDDSAPVTPQPQPNSDSPSSSNQPADHGPDDPASVSEQPANHCRYNPARNDTTQTHKATEAPSNDLAEENQVFANGSLDGICSLLPSELSDAIRRIPDPMVPNTLCADITMSFPKTEYANKVGCQLSLTVDDGEVDFIIYQMFGSRLQRIGDQWGVRATNGTLLVPASKLTFRGCQHHLLKPVFGPELAAAISASPLHQDSLKRRLHVTNAVSMVIGDSGKGELMLSLGLLEGSKIKRVLFPTQ